MKTFVTAYFENDEEHMDVIIAENLIKAEEIAEQRGKGEVIVGERIVELCEEEDHIGSDSILEDFLKGLKRPN